VKPWRESGRQGGEPGIIGEGKGTVKVGYHRWLKMLLGSRPTSSQNHIHIYVSTILLDCTWVLRNDLCFPPSINFSQGA
jgi:hypothetical protein